MQRLKTPAQSRGWAMLDALLGLWLWSAIGIALMIQTHGFMGAQRSLWRQAQAIEWQADLFERLHLAQPSPPLALEWGQNVVAVNCSDAPCAALEWRDSLLADWQQHLQQEMPGAQTWLSAWVQDPRIWVVGIRWPQSGLAMRQLPVNQQVCPSGWACSVALGWP